jgi:hypothetical protein
MTLLAVSVPSLIRMREHPLRLHKMLNWAPAMVLEDLYDDGGDDRQDPNLCKFATPDHGFELRSQLDRADARSSLVYPARRGGERGP